jgi:Ca2+-binding EF-hand superfamily protein
LDNSEIDLLMETIDADHSGQIDFDEFKTIMSDIVLKAPTKAQLIEAFKFFDLGKYKFN